MFNYRKTQSGFTLLEMGVVMIIMGILATLTLMKKYDDFRDNIGKIGGGQVLKVSAALGQYQVNYYSQLVNNTAIAGVANIYAPTIAELSALNLLPGGFQNQNALGGQYITQVSRVPAACVPPACDLSSLVWLDTPVRRPSTGGIDGAVLGTAATEIGDDAAYSRTDVPGTLQGNNWNVANPQGNVAGILGARNGFGSSGWGRFLPRDGSLPMTGTLDLGANSLIGLVSATSGNACATVGALARDAAGAVLSCQGGVWSQQGSAYWKDPVATAAALPACNAAAAWQTRVVQTPGTGSGPRAYTCDGGVWRALAVDDAGNLTIPGTGTIATLSVSGNSTLGDATSDTVTVNGTSTFNSGLTIGNGTAATSSNTLVVNRTATESAACSPNGSVARDANGLLLSCQSGVWRKAQGAGLSAWVYFNGTAATCPGGWCTIIASSNISSVFRSATGAYTVYFASAMSNTNYGVSGISKRAGGVGAALVMNFGNPFVGTTTEFNLRFTNLGQAAEDPEFARVQVFN